MLHMRARLASLSSLACRHLPTARRPVGWLHEIKRVGYRVMARRDPVGILMLRGGP